MMFSSPACSSSTQLVLSSATDSACSASCPLSACKGSKNSGIIITSSKFIVEVRQEAAFLKTSKVARFIFKNIRIKPLPREWKPWASENQGQQRWCSVACSPIELLHCLTRIFFVLNKINTAAFYFITHGDRVLVVLSHWFWYALPPPRLALPLLKLKTMLTHCLGEEKASSATVTDPLLTASV